MRIPKLPLIGRRSKNDPGRPAFLHNPFIHSPKLVNRERRQPTKANLPLWPDDEMRAHPDSPYGTVISEEAIRALCVLSGISEFGPRLVKVTRGGAIRVAPPIGSKLRSQEGSLNGATGASVTIGKPSATSVFIANDDATNAITFQVTGRFQGDGKTPDYSQETTQTIPGGAQPVSIDVEAVGINLPATGNTSAYRLWWIID